MNIANNELKISRDFSKTPGPRFIDEGEYSGELLRNSLLRPRIEMALERGEKLTIDLDGTHGYLTSFLEEAFGGLIREDGYSLSQLQSVIDIISTEEAYLKEDIEDYLEEAERES